MKMFGWGSWGLDDSNPEQSKGSFSGYLWKMKRTKKTIVPQWAKRWYSIEGRYLRWYTSPSSDEQCGEIELESVTGVNRFESSGNGVNSFVISCPDRNLLLRASSPAEMKMWMRALQMQANLAKGGNGMGILCKTQANDRHFTNLQKKLRSHTLESELDRTIAELDMLQRSISESDYASVENPESDKKPSLNTESRSSSKGKFDYVVGERREKERVPSSQKFTSHSRQNSRECDDVISSAKPRSSTREDYEYKENDDDVDLLNRDADGVEEPESDSDARRVRRVINVSRHSKRSGDYKETIVSAEGASSNEQLRESGFSIPKSFDKRNSRNAWI